MDPVCIPVPMPSGDETLELDVTVGGQRHLMQYRIERLHLSTDRTPEARFAQLKQFVQEYDPKWTLVQIGAPGEGVVPITFRQRHTASADPPDEAADRPERPDFS